jgi:hypothetical protein
MANHENSSAQHITDILAWESEMPDRLRRVVPKGVEPLEALVQTEIQEMDQKLELVLRQCVRLGILPGNTVCHTYFTEDYDAERLMVQALPKSERYDWAKCLHVTVTQTHNDIFSSNAGRLINTEDYFIDAGAQRMTVAVGTAVMAEGTFDIPPSTPTFILGSERGRPQQFQGAAYMLKVPEYEKTMDYDEIHIARNGLDRLHRLMLNLSPATLDF